MVLIHLRNYTISSNPVHSVFYPLLPAFFLQLMDPNQNTLSSLPPNFPMSANSDNLHIQYSNAQAVVSDASVQGPLAPTDPNVDPYSSLRAPPPSIMPNIQTGYTENAPFLIHPSALHPPPQTTHLYSTIEPYASQNTSYPNSFNPALQQGIHIPVTMANDSVYMAPQPTVLGAPETAHQQPYGYNAQTLSQNTNTAPIMLPFNVLPENDLGIRSVEELLAPPPLQNLMQPFLMEGYIDLGHLLTFDDRQLQHMFLLIGQRCNSMGFALTPEQMRLIASRLQQERNSRIRKMQSSFDSAPQIQPNTNAPLPGTLPNGKPHPNNARQARMARAAQLRQAKINSRVGNQLFLCAMCGCGPRSWLCLLFVGIIATVISVALLIAYLTLGKSASSENAGTWTFVLVLLIIGFIVAFVLLLSAFVSRSMWLDGQINPFHCVCCEDDGSPGFCEECCQGSSEPCCETTCCNDFSCKACDGCEIECRDCCSCCDMCDCDSCPDCCRGLRDCCMCCESCDLRPPTCDCDCCPNIRETGCWLVCYKIVCCQCKIQLA